MSKNNAGWEWKKLGEVCEVIAGQSPKGSSYNKDGIGMEFHQGKKSFGNSFVDLSGVWTSEITRIAEPDDILISVRAPVGPVNYTDRQICIGRGLAAIRAKNIDRKYLYRFLVFNESNMTSKTGAVFDSINRNDILNFNIPVPPLEEQNRIVKVLDEAFEKIDNLKSAADANLQNAKALFQTTLDKTINDCSCYDQDEIGNVFDTGAGGTPLKQHKEYYENGKIPWLRSGEVCQKDIVKTEMFITKKGMDNSSAKMFPKNSVVVAMYGATAGQVGILRIESTTNQAVCGIFPHDDFLPEYVYYCLLSGKDALVAQAVGGAQPNISQIKIKQTKIPLPPLSFQKQIVAKLDSLSEKVKQLESNYNQVVADCDELKKSILKKAFNGEL